MLRTEEEIEKKLVHFDSGIHLGVSFMSLADKSHALSLLSRYESRLHRIRDRAFKRLLDLRKAAEPARPEPPPAPPEIEQRQSNQPSPVFCAASGPASASKMVQTRRGGRSPRYETLMIATNISGDERVQELYAVA